MDLEELKPHTEEGSPTPSTEAATTGQQAPESSAQQATSSTAPAVNPTRPAPGSARHDKEMTEDFATALETFNAEQAAAEAAAEDNVVRGTVVKITATHV